jgi:hypothetical protein
MLIFIGNIPMVYPSHSLSEIPNPYKQKCQNCENPNSQGNSSSLYGAVHLEAATFVQTFSHPQVSSVF